MMRSSLWFVMPALALAACGTQTGTNTQKAGTEAGIDVAWMDKSVAPGDDFFAYANGTWAKTTEIPRTGRVPERTSSPTSCARRTRANCSKQSSRPIRPEGMTR
jgi:hypothetical protein